MEYKDYYKILNVEKTASQEDIKQAYRRLARKYHPDVSKEANAEEKFKDLQEAYEVLKDTEKRSAYDQLGSNWKQGQEFRPPPGWNANTRFYRGDTGDAFSESDMSGFSDFFSNIFGRGGRQEFRQRGQDQHAKVSVTLEEAYSGTTRTLQLQMPEMDDAGRMHQALRTIKVNIPAGVTSGQQLRLGKQGGQGVGGGAAGDLYLEIDIDTHSLFSLKGNDVYLTVPITPWEAALGAAVNIPTLGGKVGLKLAPNSQTGLKMRLKGRGMPSKPHAGDQYAILQILTPPAHTDEQKALYEKMGHVMPFNPRKDWSV